MSQVFKFKCDKCGAETPTTYNGEHHLPPKEWGEIINPVSGNTLGHLCPSCLKILFEKDPT